MIASTGTRASCGDRRGEHRAEHPPRLLVIAHLAEVNGRKLLLFGAGDGFCYAFDPTPVEVRARNQGAQDRVEVRRQSAEYRERDGKKLPYNRTPKARARSLHRRLPQQPRLHHRRPGHPPRPGQGLPDRIDPTKTGDISTTGVLWRYTGINRSMATPSVADGLVFVADYVAPSTAWMPRGQALLTHETGGRDCMVDLRGRRQGVVREQERQAHGAGGEQGEEAPRRDQPPHPIHATPIVANGVLYVPCHNYLYAVRQ